MEAPKKIYLVKDENTDKPMDYWYNAATDDSKVEYTRTDAFIEKALDYIANNMRCDGYTLQAKAKFIKGFKDYMKGE